MSKLWLPHTERHEIRNIQHGPIGKIEFVVIHVNDGSTQGTFSWWSQPGHEADGAHLQIDDGPHAKAYQCAPLNALCWHAGQANYHSIGVEHAGFHSKTEEKWREGPQLHLSANRVAWLHHEFDLGRPHVGKTIFPHAHGGAAWGGHTDCPGPNFPWDYYEHLCHIAYLDHWGRL